MWHFDYRKRGYDQTTEKRMGGTADALAECLHRVPGGCHLRKRDEQGVA